MIFGNALLNQTSPYLLQHAHNPVNWYPWGEEALHKARAENKPILLSIGYSACHWCHVMAHESFEDALTAQFMNRWFINIKVDREERPDLDKIYQTAHQILTGAPGGWPLTVFLDPYHHTPFFTGTYFPKTPRYHLPVFMDVLQQAADFYMQNYKKIRIKSPELVLALQQADKPTAFSELEPINLQTWQVAFAQIRSEYDASYGGFDSSPKFFHPTYFRFLIWQLEAVSSEKTELKSALEMAQLSLTKMALGGIYDQIGGGFYRYSVDAKWEIPHFEKMLYDNAQLLSCYAEFYKLTGDPLYKKIVRETATWVITNMQAKEGGYFSSVDADAENKEGVYYLWTPQQLKELLNEAEYQLLSLHFNLSEAENFEQCWHLHVVQSLESIAFMQNKSLAEVEQIFHTARTKLLSARNKRIAPEIDDKILTSWNALMIRGMVLAGTCLAEPAWIDSAERALQFIYENLWKGQRLLATYREQKAHLTAYVDDYAFLLEAILIFLQYRWKTKYVFFAQELADVLLNHFFDQQQGNFFFVADDHEALLYRPKVLTDGVTPAGSGIATYALQRLGSLLAESRYLAAAERSLQGAWPEIKKYPAAHVSLLLAALEYLEPPRIIIVCGESVNLVPWRAALREFYTDKNMIFLIDNTEEELPIALKEKMAGPQAVAYICQGQKCLMPVTTLEALRKALGA